MLTGLAERSLARLACRFDEASKDHRLSTTVTSAADIAHARGPREHWLVTSTGIGRPAMPPALVQGDEGLNGIFFGGDLKPTSRAVGGQLLYDAGQLLYAVAQVSPELFVEPLQFAKGSAMYNAWMVQWVLWVHHTAEIAQDQYPGSLLHADRIWWLEDDEITFFIEHDEEPHPGYYLSYLQNILDASCGAIDILLTILGTSTQPVEKACGAKKKLKRPPDEALMAWIIHHGKQGRFQRETAAILSKMWRTTIPQWKISLWLTDADAWWDGHGDPNIFLSLDWSLMPQRRPREVKFDLDQMPASAKLIGGVPNA